MKKQLLFILAILLFFGHTVSAAEDYGRPMYLKVSAEKDENGRYAKFLLSWKNTESVINAVKDGKTVEAEIDLRHNGSTRQSDSGKNTVQVPVAINEEGRTEVTLTENDFASIDEFNIFSSNYSFRVKYVGGNEFSTESTIGLRPNYKNYSKWATEELNSANKIGLISPAVQEDMRKEMTRKEFTDAVVRGYERKTGTVLPEGKNIFKDTEDPSVLKAAELGIVQGDGKGYFLPEDTMTRQEMAIMAVNFLDAVHRLPKEIPEKTFNDHEDISSWAKKAVETAGGLGILKGDPKNNFRPKGSVTREEGIILVYRIAGF